MSHRAKTVSLLAAAATALAAAVGAGDPPGGAPAATGAITGRVVDLKGRPIAGAEVWGLAFRDKVGATRADADGRFRLAPLKEDKAVTVWADAPSLARQRHEGVHVFAGRDHDIGQLVLLPGTRIRGRAVDAQGRPIAGVQIMVKDFRHTLGHTISSNQTEWTLAGDAEGHFTTTPLPVGRVEFVFAAPGKVRPFVMRDAEPGTTEADLGDITLADEVPIRGVVVDQDGQAAPGVEVIADYDYEGAVKTGKDGRFTVHGAGRDAKQLRLQSNDYFAPKPVDLGPDRTGLKLTVTKAYQIHGTALDAETGKPVPIDTVRLCRVERNPDGSYALVG
ncbi:MAG TPA: carboxypeptidase-like regulatory domain-containing protein [Isosphaeraceae bacterium]|nr:carboxypeptidase-like regulatory domain-containing protein [Isosphaeraceae bacterium]